MRTDAAAGDSVIERLKKLLALAERGVGGEAVNARELLDAAMQRHGISMDRLCDDVKRECSWPYKAAWERDLLVQVIFCVCGAEAAVFRVRFSQEVCVRCTVEQRIEIDVLWHAHRKRFAEEQKIFFDAYIHAQRLFARDDKRRMDRKLSAEEENRLDRMARMMMGIDPLIVSKQLCAAGQGMFA